MPLTFLLGAFLPLAARWERAGVKGALQQRGGSCEIFGPIGVEEWIDRAVREGHGHEPVTRGPQIDLADPLLDNRLSKILE